MPERVAYSPAEAARLLGVSRWTVYHWIYSGELPATKIGRRQMISAARLRERLGEINREEGVPA
jgi:excisionase family DNA binding protein